MTQCCRCNGNRICRGCICTKNNRVCTNCKPGNNKRCENQATILSSLIQDSSPIQRANDTSSTTIVNQREVSTDNEELHDCNETLRSDIKMKRYNLNSCQRLLLCRFQIGQKSKVETFAQAIQECYLTIRLRARDFYEVIVDEGAARINYHLIEIESEYLVE